MEGLGHLGKGAGELLRFMPEALPCLGEHCKLLVKEQGEEALVQLEQQDERLGTKCLQDGRGAVRRERYPFGVAPGESRGIEESPQPACVPPHGLAAALAEKSRQPQR